MFKHILVPTDGSPRSLRTAKAAVRFAKASGARITAFFATPEFRPDITGDFFPPSFVSLPEYRKGLKATADKYLGQVQQLADAAEVPCATAGASSDSPYQAIIKAAEANKCDLIFMASHGRRGLASLLIGSETTKVLAHCKLPVLVYR
jgi:nucleotide-binding universal stress UspA family protein